MKIVVGLGNFGDKYAYTYHNMGFLAVECLADKLKLEFDKRDCSSLIARGSFLGEKIVLAKPLTFMNLSGKAVVELLAKFKAGTRDVLVVFDDIDIEKGALRFRERGSGGTHNGMRHIISQIGEDFPRLRIGISKGEGDLADYVLGEVPKEDRPLMYKSLENAADTAIKWLKDSILRS